MSKPKKWSKQVTLTIRRKMADAANSALRNGQDLLFDAELLMSANRFARATALAILAEEEFSKASILLICAVYGRWDSEIFKALQTHSSKQGFSEGFSIVMNVLLTNAKLMETLNKTAILKSQPSWVIDPAVIEEGVRTAQFHQEKRPIDLIKQQAFYVCINDEVELQSIPSLKTQKDSEECIKNAKRFESIAQILVQHFPFT